MLTPTDERKYHKCSYNDCRFHAVHIAHVYQTGEVDPFFETVLCAQHTELWKLSVITDKGFSIAQSIVRQTLKGRRLNYNKKNGLIRKARYTETLKGTKGNKTMPLPFVIRKEDLLRGKVVTPGWYKLKINNITQRPGKKDETSTTTVFDMEIVDGPNKEFIGVPIQHYASEKAPGMVVPLLEALAGQKLDEQGVDLDLESAIGREVSGYIKNQEFQNRMTNKITEWRRA